jgi:hypothetical protein
MALQPLWTLAAFSVSWMGACRKAATYTQNNTNTESAQLGLLERANFNQLRLVLSKGPNWVGVFPPHLRTETDPVSETLCLYVIYEVFTAGTMKNVVFWDVALCRSCVNRRFGGTYCLHLHGRKICEWGTSMSRWLQTEPRVGNNQLYKNRERGRVGHVENQQIREG